MVDVIELAIDIHANENKKWWYDSDGNKIENPPFRVCMLIISELAEALEGVRKNLNDDKLAQYKMFDVELADAVIRLMDAMVGFIGVESVKQSSLKYKKYQAYWEDPIEFLDYITRKVVMLFNPGQPERKLSLSSYLHIIYEILDYCFEYDIDIITIINEKREYNKVRLDHSDSERQKENGKRF